MITVTLHDGQKIQVEPGTTLEELAEKFSSKDCPIVGASVNYELEDLRYKITEPVTVQFFDISSDIGNRIYEKSLTLVFIRAVSEILPDSTVMIEHSISKGLYCEIKGECITYKLIKKIEEKMQEIITADEELEKLVVSKDEAIEIFKRTKQLDKVKILETCCDSKVVIYKCGNVYSLFYDYLVPRTGYLKLFALQFHLPGIIIQYPTTKEPNKIPEYIPQPKLAKVFYEAERWAEIMEVNTVGDLNELISKNKISLLIKVAEALHEKKIANIADEITARKDRGNIILIAGPSSSGKTTFAQRLMIQLMVNGLKPISISLDNYFIDRDKMVPDENGEIDFEALDALDVELFNEQLASLIQGQKVRLSYYDFLTGKRSLSEKETQIRPDQPIIIEGIHGLNDKLTYSIPDDHKFKIYISCLTQLNIDNYNRIPTNSVRKIRRMVRDFKYRGYSAEETLKMWSSVRRGEEKNIFPYQENADVMFNSSLIYELAVLRPFAEPLLKAIEKESEQYIEAQKLLEFISCFKGIKSDEVPLNSILREFIGN